MSYLDLGFMSIQKIENLPKLLTKFECAYNQIQKIENLPNLLTEFSCSNNQIQKIENLPKLLTTFYCWRNQIQKIENLPNLLTKFDCSDNQIQKIENLPLGLKYISYDDNPINSIDCVSDKEVNFKINNYSNLKRVQLRMKRNFKPREAAAKIIQRGAYNWVFKAVCKDSKFGVNFRIGLRDLQAIGLLTE